MPKLTPHQAAALNYKKHISLTANAGSGKTFVLANRYIEIALQENIPLNKIVAITFTEKAAGELNKKIANEIDDRIINEKNSEKLNRLQRIRRQLTSANISTIHSFCINLLKEYSPEIGVDANFSPINQQDAEELLELTIEDFISRNISNSELSKDIKDIIRLLGGKSTFVNQLKAIVRFRKPIEKLGLSLYLKSNEEIYRFYTEQITNILNEIINLEFDPLIKLISQLNNRILEFDEQNQTAVEIRSNIEKYLGEELPQNKIQHVKTISESLLTKSNRTIKKRGYRKDSYEIDDAIISDIENIFNEIKSLISISFDEKSLHTLIGYSKKIFKIVSQILTGYDEQKRKNGYLDFEDILLVTKELTSKDNFADLLKDRYEYIMIDEYQDTNEIQYEIFMPILNNLKRGNLFVVGDEKQSIYMFREAELKVFHKTKDEITKVNEDGKLLLPHSFRVSPQIAHFTNELFANLFKNANALYNEVEYNELICSRPRNDNGKIEFLINTDEELSEAEFIADKIINSINNDSNFNWSDFAILCRKRKDFFELEKTFNDFNIPSIIAGGKGFYQRQTVYDVYNYIAFLLNPGDDAAFVGILRSPFYSLSDETIFEISLQPGKNFFERFRSYCHNYEQYYEILSLLKRHITLASSIRLPALLREIFRSCEYWGAAASMQNYEQEISNLFKLLGLSRKFSVQSFKSLYDFKAFLNEAISFYEDEGQAQISNVSNTVKIMTLHQSKGLEFKNVFLFNCNGKFKDDSVRAKKIVVDKTWGILTKVPINENYFSDYVSPSVIDLSNFIEYKKQVAEAKRLFYVGVTRAVDNLFLSGTVLDNKIERNSFFDFVITGLNIDFQNDGFELNSHLLFMADESKNFIVTNEIYSTEVKIEKSFSQFKKADDNSDSYQPIEEFFDNNITDHEKNEIVSATKIAIFNQCPTKYYLTYELGYTELFKLSKTFIIDYEFKYNEDENLSIYADIRGQIIHKVLEEETKLSQLEEKVNKLISKYDYRIDSNKDKLLDSILTELRNYYESDTYKRLKQFPNFKNEYEIYSKESNYYIYGIIDKLIISDSSVTIVDYKTDNISLEKLLSKSEHYIPQLKFYAYAVSKKFKEAEKIDVDLIFVKQPENPIKYSFKKEEIIAYGEEIKRKVDLIRAKQFGKNLSHCHSCHFSLNGICVFQP